MKMPDKKKSQAGGDAPEKNKQVKIDPIPRPKGKGKEIKPPVPEEIPKTPSQIEREKVEHRALLRKQRFKPKWPEIKKPKIRTVPWQPPPPPEKRPRVMVPLPEIVITRKWIPPFKRRRRRRPRLQRIPLEEITQPLYECAKMKKIWHNFGQVDKNKMVLQGHLACNSKRSPTSGAHTACIAVVCRGLLEEKTAAELVKTDVNDVIVAGEHFYRQCMTALKCYKGKPQLQLNQLLTSFYLHDMKYTVKMDQIDKGLLAKHPDNTTAEPDLMSLMEKRIGTTYMMILSTGDKHFLIWGHPPPPESGSQVKTVCYMFDPHMLDQNGEPHKLFGAGAFLRYAGVSSFVMDFLVNYGKLDAAKKGGPKTITLTNIEVVQKEPLLREPDYELNLKTLNIHCKDEWEAITRNMLLEKKLKEGKYPQGSLSAVSLATSKATSRRKVQDFYQKTPKETAPQLPVPPEKAPLGLTDDEIKQTRGEDFFLYCPRPDNHAFGRDDMISRPKSETMLYSPVDIADKNFRSQYQQVNAHKWILRGTRHMASYRYQSFKTFTGVACCVTALMTLLRLRARAWNEDIVDETLDLGFNFYRESLAERGRPIRRLVLGELKENLKIRNKEYTHKERGIAVWGKLVSNDPKVLDLCKGIESFFKESDCGILQIPGELEVAIFNEGERFYVYHPWPADRHGYRVGLQGGGKACLLYFTQLSDLCEHFMESVRDLKRKPFSISDVMVAETGGALPEPVNNLKPVAPNRWAIKGRFHEDDERFPEEHRGKQSSPNSIAAIAYAHVLDPASWTANDVDECLVRGDTLYGKTMDYMDKMGITLEPFKAETEEGDEEEVVSAGPGFLGPANVLNKFQLSDYESVETDVQENAYSGRLSNTRGSQSLRDSLRRLFKEHSHAVLTARGGATAIWKQDENYYYFDPHGCNEKGISSDEPLAGACLVRMKGSVEDLANVIMGNLAPGTDDTFNISPVTVSVSRINPVLGAPETKLESKAFEWISKGTAAILMGPRGENTAIGKAAEKAGIGKEDMAGRTLALPAAAAFVAASAAVPPPHMHQDHMFNFIDTGKDYYVNHVKKTGKKEMAPEDLSEKFEMGVNTFNLELGEPIKLPLRLPDEPKGEGEEGEEDNEKELEGEYEEEVKEEPLKQIKDVLYRTWNDPMQPTSTYLLVGDYHQMGVWMSSGGKVVAFDPAPTLTKGLLTAQRVKKGDELRLQRIKDEMTGEGGGEEEEEEDEEAMGEGEEKLEPIPEFVPPESCPALMVFASPIEFIDKLTTQGRLDRKQCLAPYKLYPVTVTNQMTSSVPKDKPGVDGAGDEEAEGISEDAEDVPLSDEAIGKYFTKIGKDMASVRGRVGQNDNFYMDPPNRDNQDVANSAMGIVADHIEPHIHWKGRLLDAIVQFGDRLHSRSVQHASRPPRLQPSELPSAFHVTNFDVNLEVESDVVTGDITAGEHGSVLSLARGIAKFFESHSHGILCCKNYCVGIWKGSDDKSVCLWEPHSVGPTGVWAPGGAATLVVMASPQLLAETFKKSIDRIARPGLNKFSISAVNVTWDLSKVPRTGVPESAIPDEGYECKVLTAFVETAKGRSILRGSRPTDLTKFTREAILQSACGAIVAACMAHVRKPHLWTRLTVDEVMTVACHLFNASIANLGYEFRPGDDVLLPLQVLKRFILGVNYVRYDIDQVYTGKLEQKEPTETTVRSALEQFFEHHTHGILWSAPCAVAVWRVPTSPPYYMMEPHACGPTGLRTDAQDDGAACVLTFTSPKLMAFAYIQNVSPADRLKRHFILYSMSITVRPIKNFEVDPPLVKSAPGVLLVPATSKVGVDGYKRRALESDRKHPPGDVTCADAERAALQKDETDTNVKGQRNSSGWLVLSDGSQFLSAHHSMCCKKFPHASRGHQALSCSIMAVAMSRVEDVCRWCSTTLDQILESGDQLYQDSYLHYRPASKVLAIDQILRKFYTPGNCVCRVVVFVARQKGNVDSNLLEQLTAFFREERAGVFVAGDGNFAVALFRTPRGFYMFDPDDRDRVGRAVAPACRGRARACFSQYPTVKSLAEKLRSNIPPALKQDEVKEVNAPDTNLHAQGKEEQGEKKEEKEVRFEEPAMFAVHGVDVTALRRINQYEL